MDGETFDAVLADMRTGMSAQTAARAHRVDTKRFWAYVDRDAATAERYTRARYASLDAMAEEAVAIADNPDIPSDKARVMVDTRKWFLSKLAPKRYGDHLEVTVSANRAANALQDADLAGVALRVVSALPVIDAEKAE